MQPLKIEIRVNLTSLWKNIHRTQLIHAYYNNISHILDEHTHTYIYIFSVYSDKITLLSKTDKDKNDNHMF